MISTWITYLFLLYIVRSDCNQGSLNFVVDGSSLTVSHSSLTDNQTQAISCPSGYVGTVTVSCSGTTISQTNTCAGLCTTLPLPSGSLYSDTCNNLHKNGVCRQYCLWDYADNNNGNGQTYRCPNGVFTPDLEILTCVFKSDESKLDEALIIIPTLLFPVWLIFCCINARRANLANEKKQNGPTKTVELQDLKIKVDGGGKNTLRTPSTSTPARISVTCVKPSLRSIDVGDIVTVFIEDEDYDEYDEFPVINNKLEGIVTQKMYDSLEIDVNGKRRTFRKEVIIAVEKGVTTIETHDIKSLL